MCLVEICGPKGGVLPCRKCKFETGLFKKCRDRAPGVISRGFHWFGQVWAKSHSWFYVQHIQFGHFTTKFFATCLAFGCFKKISANYVDSLRITLKYLNVFLTLAYFCSDDSIANFSFKNSCLGRLELVVPFDVWQSFKFMKDNAMAEKLRYATILRTSGWIILPISNWKQWNYCKNIYI